MAQPLLSPKWGTRCVPFMWAEYNPPLVVEPWLLMAGQWEGFTQASQVQGLGVTIDHQPLPSVEDQLCRGNMVVLQCCL